MTTASFAKYPPRRILFQINVMELKESCVTFQVRTLSIELYHCPGYKLPPQDATLSRFNPFQYLKWSAYVPVIFKQDFFMHFSSLPGVPNRK